MKSTDHDQTTVFPDGWDEERVQGVLSHYETQNDEESALEDDAAFGDEDETVMRVPLELVPAVRKLMAGHRKAA